MQSFFTFTPKEGPLTIFGSLLVGTVHLGQYQVHLRGYRCFGPSTGVEVCHNPCLNLHVDLPELVVESWADWKNLLASTPGEIYFGDGFEDPELSLEEFIKMVEERAGPHALGRDGQPLSSPYDYIHSSGKDSHQALIDNPNLLWKDEDGYSFTTLKYL